LQVVNEADLDRVAWHKSGRSGSGENCVEVARVRDVYAIRDSKNPSGPALAFTRPEWEAFVNGVKTHAFTGK
jgi:hypothetical protein